ncbi:alpha/beta hydrolase [Streptomyces sp. NBC_01136]|uniref:RBBP9/YdeN family alpha/beta hydrolase n=1 Tax=unclassified Streptomyces TaxID=2593676 RepID=UPI0032469A0F|nr:alpha/beta hydrolase [Streptomyces sp. NBC_01136]
MTSISRSYLILHGWQNHRPEGHWQHWLASELTALGHAVTYPQLPDPDHPRLEVWLDRLHTHLDAQRHERVVVCHSLAVPLWLHAVARGRVRADRVLLVAPPSEEVIAGYEDIAGFGAPAATAAHLRTAAPVTRLVATDNDPYCPHGAAKEYGVPLGLDTDLIPGAAHLDMEAGYGDWPSALTWCLNPTTRISARPTRA